MMRAVSLFVSLCAAFVLLGLFALSTTAQEPIGTDLSEARIEARTAAIAKTLRCVVCQNQSIHDSSAPLAADMTRLVRERVRAGDTDAEARAYLQARYGDFVLMEPPFQLNTLFLWLGPLVILMLATGWYLLRTRRASGVPADQIDRRLTVEEATRIALALRQNNPGGEQ